tara:strand:+ start:1513 stop:1716 length:204 start_codon:yes stop_codon:yes gene_type:complete
MIDTETYEQILRDDEIHPDALQALGLNLLEAYKQLVIVADELYLHIVGEPHMTLDELVAKMPWRNEE